VLLVAALAVTSACSGSTRQAKTSTNAATTSSTGPSSVTPAPHTLRAAALAWANAYMSGTPQSMLSLQGPECAPQTHATFNERAAEAELRQLRHQIQLHVGEAPSAIKISGVRVRNVTARSGEAEVQYDLPPTAVGNYNWVTYQLHGGRWLVADCHAPIGGESSSGSSTPTTPAKPLVSAASATTTTVSAIVGCTPVSDAAKAASAVFYANNSKYPTAWHDLLNSNPTLLELPAGVRVADDYLVSQDGWRLTMAGGGTTAPPTFTCSVAPH